MSDKNQQIKTTTKPSTNSNKTLPQDDRHVVARRRRPRKNITSTTTTTTSSSSNDNDNNVTIVSSLALDKENNAFLSNPKASTSSSEEGLPSTATIIARVLTDFCTAQKNTCQADYWKKKHINSSLSQVIIETSCNLSSSLSSSSSLDGGGFSLLLEEHTLELLQVCRKLVVQATTTTTSKNKKENLTNVQQQQQQKEKSDSLTVAIHIFRALCRNNSILSCKNPTKQESVMRLLYHVIVTASEQAVVAAAVSSAVASSKKEKNDKSTIAITATTTTSTTTAIHQSLAAYEALGYLLQDYTFHHQQHDANDSSTTTTVFRCCSNGGENDNNDGCSTTFHAALFPVPVQQRSRKKTTTNSSGLTLEQVCAIGIQATRAIVKILLLPCAMEACTMTTTNYSSCIPYTFINKLLGGVGNNKNNNASSSSPREAAIHLLRFIILQWMLFQANSSSNSSLANSSKELISQCKQNHHVLWDAAAALSSQQQPVECLRLRQEALLAFLAIVPHPCGNNTNDNDDKSSKRRNKFPTKMLSALHAKNFETACSFAWKAAITFARETNCSPCDPIISMGNNSLSSTAAASFSSILCTFHEAIGVPLDLIAAHQKLSVLPYVEYCVHRARHLGPCIQQQNSCVREHCTSKSCLFQHLPYPCLHQSCMFEENGKGQQQQEQPNYEPTLALCLLVSYLDHQLQQQVCDHDSSQTTPVQLDNNLSTDFIRGAREIVKQYQECEVKRHQTNTTKRVVVDTATRLRLFKLHSVDSLLRTIFQLLETDGWKSHGLFVQTLLELTGIVLVDCLGPVAFQLANDASLEEGKRPWLLSVQCFTRGIGIFELLCHYHKEDDDAHEQERFLQLSHSAQQQLVEQLSGKRTGLLPPTSMIEMAAKNLFNVGRQRQDMQLRNGHSAVPLLSGIQLFTEVTRHASEPSETCQLSARWAFVAKDFMSQERNDAAIVSIISALAYVGVEQASRSATSANGKSDDDDNDAVNLFVFICSLSKDNLPTGLVEEAAADSEQNQTRGLIAKLINLFAERERSQFTPVEKGKTLPFTAGQAIERLLDDLKGVRPLAPSFEQYCNVPFCLSTLVQVMFARGTIPSELILCPKVVMLQKIRLFVGFLVRYALSLQLDTWGEGSIFDAAFTEYDFLVRLVASFIRKVLADRDNGSSSVTLGAFYVMASVCLVSSHPATNLDGWCFGGIMSKNADDSPHARKFAILSGFAKKYASKAASTLSCVSGTENNDWTLTASAMLPAVSLYQLRLSYMQQNTSASSVSDLGSLSDHVFKAVNVLTNNESDSTLLSISKRCFVSILSRYYDWLSLRGERLNALQIATWNRNMARSLGPTHLSQWLEATTLSQSARETYLPRQYSRQEVQVSGKTSIAVVEIQACRLRSQLLGALAVPELRNVRASLHALLDQLHVLEPHPEPSQVELLIPWVRSTVVSGLADAAHVNGEVEAALCHYKACLRECQLAAVALGHEKRVIPGPSGVGVPFWESVPVSSAILRYRDRQVECLMRISLVHENFGDYKKATTYAISAVQRAGLESSTNCSSFTEYIESIKQETCESGRERQLRRLLLGVKARATALDIVQNELVETDVLVTKSSLDCESLFSADQDLEVILDNLAFNSLLNEFSSHPYMRSFYDSARSNYDQLVRQPQIERLAALLPGRIASSVLYDLKLAEAKSSFSSKCETGRESVVRSNCEEIIRAPAATTSCRAEAFYLLGLLDLGHARESGALAAIWHGSSNLETTASIEDSLGHALDRARASFTAALSMLGPASTLSTRCALRSLALVSGPQSDHNVNAASTCILIHTSIGSGSRQHVRRALSINDTCDSHDQESSAGPVSAESIHGMFAALDTSLISEKRAGTIDEFLLQLKALTPPNWSYVASTICPTGELLVSSLSTKEDTGELVAKTACIFPDGNEYGEFEVGAYDQMLKPLDSIIYRMDHTIKAGKDPNSMEEAEKRDWWNGRKTLDLELQTLIETVEEDFFSTETIRSVLDGASSNEDDYKRAAHFGASRGNLASLFEAATQESPSFAESEPSCEHETQPGEMMVAELREELVNLGFEAKNLRKRRKAELVDLVTRERQRCRQKQTEQRSVAAREGASNKEEKGCTILVLDENLHRFPFEGLPIFEGKIVCRVPSLPFAIAKLAELSSLDKNVNGGAKVNGNYTSYVVDPESNLSTTKDRLLPFLESFSEKHGDNWKGVVGEAPSHRFIEESLLTDNGLFLYFGHGCGKPYFSRKQIESLIQADQSGDGLRRKIRSSVVLMGCSSGRLESVNRRNTKSITDELPIYYDPEGTALSYLSAGAPCVIGNLWDVTDVDIDRYAIQMLGQFFDNDDDDDAPSTVSLAECVAQARSACRMRYLVGCAPVCYGIPVYRG